MIRAGIFGATGYAGYELVKLLQHHPNVTIQLASSTSSAGKTLDHLYPMAPPLPLVATADAPLDQLDVAFLALPHAAAAETAVQLLEAGVRVIDLSADFRLDNADTYAHWYNHPHPAPHLLREAIYGLTECARAQLPTARLVANPGCYPTSILLPLMPLLNSQLTVTGPIIADAKSGISGAGRAPKLHTHFVEASNNFSPYKIGRTHRHLPEIEQIMHRWSPQAPALIFSPHLLPVPRGILSTIYVPLDHAPDETLLRELYGRFYHTEPFVTLLPAGELATLAHVTHTNRCVIALTVADQMLIITSALDNLQKGAAGQAIQNMNVMFGLEETAALVY